MKKVHTQRAEGDRGMTAVGVIIFLGILVLLGALLYLMTNKNGTENTDGTATTTPDTASSTSQLTEFQNAKYGFSFKYPSTLVATTTFQGFQHVATSWRQGAVGKPTSGEAITAIVTNSLRNAEGEEGYYFDAEMRVGGSTSTQAVKDCLVRSTDEDTATTSVMINGVPFTKFTRQSAGMSQYGMVESYRTVHASTSCIAIESIIAGGGTALNNPSQSETLKAQQKQIIDSIIQTFTFTR